MMMILKIYFLYYYYIDILIAVFLEVNFSSQLIDMTLVRPHAEVE